MNKNVKSLIDKAKDGIGKSLRVVRENKKVKVSIVAGLTAVIVASGITYYVLNNKDTGNKEIVSSDTIKEDEIKSDGSIVKVDKVEGSTVQTESGQTVKPTPKPPVIADNNNNTTSKPSTGTDKPSTDNNSGNSNNNNNSESNKPSNGNNGSSNNSGSTNKPQEPSKPTPPVVEQPKPEVKPEPPKRTWTYMADMSRETFNLMNKFRQDNGVAPLKWSDSEHARAKKQAEYNAKTYTGGHDFGQISILTKRSTASDFIGLWEKSPGHKESMLDSRNSEGAVAVYKDSDGVYYVVASFADGFDWD